MIYFLFFILKIISYKKKKNRKSESAKFEECTIDILNKTTFNQ